MVGNWDGGVCATIGWNVISDIGVADGLFEGAQGEKDQTL